MSSLLFDKLYMFNKWLEHNSGDEDTTQTNTDKDLYIVTQVWGTSGENGSDYSELRRRNSG